MSVKYAVLGLLSEEPMHGYRLKAAFDGRVGRLWGLTTAQIYQILKALERRGLVDSRVERVGSRPTRRTYSLTPSGARALRRWLDAIPARSARPFRADLLLRLLFLRDSDLARLTAEIDRQEQYALRLQTRVQEMLSAERIDAGVDVLALFLDGFGHHIDADLKLLRRVREALRAWSATRQAPPRNVEDPWPVPLPAPACNETDVPP